MAHIGASPDIQRLKKSLENALKPESRALLFLIYSEIDKLQGFAFANVCSGLESGADYLWINELHIDEMYRRQGLAAGLLDYIEDWARSQKMPYMACITSLNNTEAQSLYNSKDFNISKTIWVDKKMETK